MSPTRVASVSAEKRRYPRLAVAIEVDGTWTDLEGERRKLSALMTMVSEGGLQLRCTEPIPANVRVKLKMKLGKLRRFEVSGQVRWWRRVGDGWDLGVELDEPARRLGAFVEKELVPGARRRLTPNPSPASG